MDIWAFSYYFVPRHLPLLDLLSADEDEYVRRLSVSVVLYNVECEH